jgi:hypothetical protein
LDHHLSHPQRAGEAVGERLVRAKIFPATISQVARSTVDEEGGFEGKKLRPMSVATLDAKFRAAEFGRGSCAIGGWNRSTARPRSWWQGASTMSRRRCLPERIPIEHLARVTRCWRFPRHWLHEPELACGGHEA